MNIVGTLTGTVEQEDVRQFIRAKAKKERLLVILFTALLIFV